jgi:hypothetical protein
LAADALVNDPTVIEAATAPVTAIVEIMRASNERWCMKV